MSYARMSTTPLLDRAEELARSGDCRGVGDIEVCLAAEGYYLGGHLDRPSLRRTLQRLCDQAVDRRALAAEPAAPAQR